MADVALFLEGTYPYQAGGVAACVHQLIELLPELSFQLVYIGNRSDDYPTPRYQLPANVVGIHEIFLFDEIPASRFGARTLAKPSREALRVLHRELHQESPAVWDDVRRKRVSLALDQVFEPDEPDNPLLRSFQSKSLWDQILLDYQAAGARLPFLDFFYTWRSAHLPVYRVLGGWYPPARVMHSLSAGYAGLAALRASRVHGAPLVMTEHGLYAHERAIEITEQDWKVETSPVVAAADPNEILKQWWGTLFRNMSGLAYGFSSDILALFEGNSSLQISDGAPSDRVRVIPNGIGKRFLEIRMKRPPWLGPSSTRPFVIGFIGRVVSIKDIKTLLKTVHAVRDLHPKIECWIVGPTTEDPAYFEECMELMSFLELTDVVRFMGARPAIEIYPQIDCLVLTSISEAQPLVILEAGLAGVPVVATDVGACSEMLSGASEADRNLGSSGLIAPVGDADQIAERLLRLIRDSDLWLSCAKSGVRRVTNYYDERELVSRYGALYRERSLGRGVITWPA